jgi:hypothetical protein
MAKKSDILIVYSKTIIMNIRKKIVNILSYFLILFIIVSAFIFFPRSKANATLILCANPQSKVFVVIDDQYTCPSGYNLVDDEYNLRQSGYTQDVTYDPTNPTINNNSNNNPVVTTTTVNNGVVVSGNANASTNNIIPVVTANNYENTIMPDPSLASGPFLNLDPTDYPYCLSLSHDLSYGIRDSNTGGVSAVILAQRACELPQTGIFDDVLKSAIVASPQSMFLYKYTKLRTELYQRILTANKKYACFKFDWLDRAALITQRSQHIGG